MGEVSTIGRDIAKSVFQVHGVDVGGAVVIRRRVSRAKVLEFFGVVSCRASRLSGRWRLTCTGSRIGLSCRNATVTHDTAIMRYCDRV